MARLWQSGFELNSLTNGVEFTSIIGSPTIQTGTVRTGTYAGKVVSVSATGLEFVYQFSATDISSDIRIRFYFRMSTLPNAINKIFNFQDSTSNDSFNLQLSTAGLLTMQDNSGSTIGSGTTLNTNQWYRIEVRNFNTSTTVALLVDGVSIASSSAANTAVYREFHLGSNLGAFSTDSAGVFYFDDLALNDTTGTSQTGYPGVGQIVHLKPSATGDNNAFTVQVGGTAGSSNNYTRVNEVTPDDVTTYNGDALSGDIDDFNLDDTPSSIGSSDTINVVAVGVRYRAVVAAAEAAFKVRIKKAASGTVSSSAAITPNSTTWKTNANAAPVTYPLVTYQNPDSAAWTKALLDTAQAGYTISTTNTNAADISTLWVSVDSTPAVVVTNPFLTNTISQPINSDSATMV